MKQTPAPLSDDAVYELLHEALLLFQNRTVETPLGIDVLTIMIKQIELMQRSMIIVREGDRPLSAILPETE